MGEVYRARDSRLAPDVAIKVLLRRSQAMPSVCAARAGSACRWGAQSFEHPE